jgi:hypothetical protein
MAASAYQKKVVMNRFFSFDLRQSSDIFTQDSIESGDYLYVSE